MSEFKVEKGVQLPPQRTGRPAGGTKYPWNDMEIGDSFFSQATEGRNPKEHGDRVTRAGNNWAKRRKPGVRFAFRTVEGGTRIWRVA